MSLVPLLKGDFVTVQYTTENTGVESISVDLEALRAAVIKAAREELRRQLPLASFHDLPRAPG